MTSEGRRSMLFGKAVLIMDDSKPIRLLVRKVLESEGAIVIEAESVEQGLAAISGRAPQVIICDLHLPGASGFDFLEHRVETKRIRSIPTLVISSSNDAPSIQRAISIGVDDYIIKPFTAAVLVQKVKKALGSRPFLSRKIDDAELSRIRVLVPAEITGMNEVGFRLESPVRLAAHENLAIWARVFEENLGRKQILTRTSEHQGAPFGRERYLSNVNFIGMDHGFGRAVRALLGGGK